jgi:hypothetical protein
LKRTDLPELRKPSVRIARLRDESRSLDLPITNYK